MGFTKKPFVKKYTDDERFAAIRTNIDIVSRMATEIHSLHGTLEDQLNNGKDGLDINAFKEALILVEEKANLAKRKVWSSIILFCELYHINYEKFCEELHSNNSYKPNNKSAKRRNS